MPPTTPPGFISNPSILFTHGRRAAKAFVLLHGLTASPEQFASFGRVLYQRGGNVLIPLLPHHGHADRLTDALQALTAEELEEFARASLARARELGERVIVAGFSVGGLVAARIAQDQAVDRAVSIAPFLGINGVPHGAGAPAMRLMRRLPNRFMWWDPFLRERQMPAHGYPRYPTHAVAEAYRFALGLFDDARHTPPQAREIAMVVNASETTVNNRSALRLARMWSAHTAAGVVETVRLRGLPPSHDIIEPLRSPEVVARVYPQLLELIDR